MREDLNLDLTHIYIGRNMVREMNHTFITLILKLSGNEYLEHFQPISYVNRLYKIHAKILAT